VKPNIDDINRPLDHYQPAVLVVMHKRCLWSGDSLLKGPEGTRAKASGGTPS
jgi:hypothetical protein